MEQIDKELPNIGSVIAINEANPTGQRPVRGEPRKPLPIVTHFYVVNKYLKNAADVLSYLICNRLNEMGEVTISRRVTISEPYKILGPRREGKPIDLYPEYFL